MAPRPHHLAGHVWAARWTCGRRLRTVRPRGTGDWLLLVTIAGAGRFRSGGQAVTLPPGSLAVVRPETPEDYGTDPEVGTWEVVWVHVHPRPHWLPWLVLPPVLPGVGLRHLPPDRFAEVLACVERAVVHAQVNQPLDRALGYLAVEEALVRHHPLPAEAAETRRLEQAQAFMEDHLGQTLSCARIAAEAGCSPRHLGRLFMHRLGVGVRVYLEQRRLAMAAELLQRTDLPIGDIARRCGFPNAFHFSTRFRRQHGAPPRTWRRGRGET